MKRKLKRIEISIYKKNFDMSKKGEYTIDDDTGAIWTWIVSMKKLDRTNSTLGESALYYMLRNPKG